MPHLNSDILIGALAASTRKHFTLREYGERIRITRERALSLAATGRYRADRLQVRALIRIETCRPIGAPLDPSDGRAVFPPWPGWDQRLLSGVA